MTYATEILSGSWYGIITPKDIRVFDCRSEELIRTPWGDVLFGSEKAAVDVGLRGVLEDGERFSHDTMPVSCQTYIDSRGASEGELSRQVEDMKAAAYKLLQEYNRLVPPPKRARWDRIKHDAIDRGRGGQAHYLPVAMCLCNFGWDILADRRVSRTRYF